MCVYVCVYYMALSRKYARLFENVCRICRIIPESVHACVVCVCVRVHACVYVSVFVRMCVCVCA